MIALAKLARWSFRLGLLIVAAATSTNSATADTCSGRASICRAACTPQNVGSGVQHGGTVEGCVASCQSRLSRCFRTGIWVHMGAARRGEEQRVERR
jgi:hypothetical protein